jgi:hypothetical protein
VSSDISEAKRRLPLPELMRRRGLGEQAKKSACCPFHDDKRNSFSVWQPRDGLWWWKCFTGCGDGDEITFLEKLDGVSTKDAIRRFLQIAGINGTTAAQETVAKACGNFDWQRCVDAFTDKHLERLGEWRGYRSAFCSWLRNAGLVGLWQKCIAFPVHDCAGQVVAVHYWQKDAENWYYYPNGAKVRPLVIGELVVGDPVHIFESQWDAFALMDVSGERSDIIVTRGASNGAMVSGLIPEGSTAYAWTQNDAAGEKWQKDICAKTKAAVKRAKIPAPHKDLDDWTRAGGNAEELLKAIESAAPITPLQTTKLDLSLVLDSICQFLDRYIKFSSPAQPTAIALWVAHTWALDAFDYTPYLHILSPEKRCGKTRLLDCIELIASKPWRTISPTEAVLFRKIEAHKPTLLLDEVDAVFCGGKDERKEPLRALLNAGFERKAKIPRCVGQSFQVQDFAVFCAKALAGIATLPDTVSDRCIPIRLIRRSREESVERFRKREAETAVTPIYAGFAEWARRQDTIEKLRAARPDVPAELSDRNADICEPLLAIADLAGGDWSKRGRNALVSLCAGEIDEDESIGVRLLSAIREVFDATGADRLATKELLEQLVNQDTDAPWAGWWEHDLKNDNIKGPGAKLAKYLKPFRIKSRGVRLADGTTRGYTRADFEDEWKRYCPAKTA